MEQRDLLSNDLSINQISQANLLSSAKWGRFLAIIGFVFCGLMLIGGVAASAFMSSMGSYSAIPFMQYMGIIYIVFAVIFFFPCLYLLKFSNKINNAIATSNQESLDVAFANLKAMFKFYGIFTIVILVIYALAFIVGMSGMFMR